MSSKSKITATRENAKQALVPKLRFPEFQSAGEWITEKLAAVSTICTEKVGNKTCVPMSITSGVGLVSQEDKFGRVIAGDSYKNYLLLKPNEFAYNKSATKEYPEGFLTLYSGTKLAAVPNSIFTCFRINGASPDVRFLNYQFSDNLHGRWLRRFIQVGARAHGSLSINDNDLMALPVPVPSGAESVAEQQKIAECLSSVGKLLAAQARKVDSLKTHKKGLMQQLFPREGEAQPRLRFPEFQNSGEWVRRRLGDFADVSASGDLDSSTFSPECSEEHCFPIYSNAVEKEGIYGFSSAARSKANSVTITARGTLGRAFLRTTDFVGIGRLIVVSNFEGEVDSAFLKECWDHLAAIPQEVTSIPQLTAVAARSTSLPFPTLAEQQHIAACLSSLDALTTAETQKLEALKAHKKGLMQQLFPCPEANA